MLSVVSMVAAIIPIYIFGVYPLVPQQIGGGAFIPVAVSVTTQQGLLSSALPIGRTYLVDRGTATTVFFVRNPRTGRSGSHDRGGGHEYSSPAVQSALIGNPFSGAHVWANP